MRTGLYCFVPLHLMSTDDFDVTCAMGVLTVSIGDNKGTYVINKQAPNRQVEVLFPRSLAFGYFADLAEFTNLRPEAV